MPPLISTEHLHPLHTLWGCSTSEDLNEESMAKLGSVLVQSPLAKAELES